MANQHANHSINDFKQFVKKHPKLIKEVRKEQRSWQDVYENWVLFGESDPIWDPYREPEEASFGRTVSFNTSMRASKPSIVNVLKSSSVKRICVMIFLLHAKYTYFITVHTSFKKIERV